MCLRFARWAAIAEWQGVGADVGSASERKRAYCSMFEHLMRHLERVAMCLSLIEEASRAGEEAFLVQVPLLLTTLNKVFGKRSLPAHETLDLQLQIADVDPRL